MENKIKNKSIMTVPIIGISYKVKKQTTICKIRWINPCNGNTQITCGIATCNPKDSFDTSIGQRLSESRAKINMYHDYIRVLSKYYHEAARKHINLINKEIQHQIKVKPIKNNI